MTFYITLDGDDVGNKLASSFIENDSEKLTYIVGELNDAVTKIRNYLENTGMEIIVSAADGITCRTTNNIDIDSLAEFMTKVGNPELTFSIGIGRDLRSAFFALKYAKAVGKNKIVTNLNQEYEIHLSARAD